MTQQPQTWELDNLEDLGGHRLSLTGAPRLTECPPGRAVEFDGESDSILLDTNPLAGLEQYTVEIVFRPDEGGLQEQRFFHIGSVHEDRLLFETRLTGDGSWYLDTFVGSGASSRTLLNQDHLHPTGMWYHLAVTCDGKLQTNYVNGEQENSGAIDFIPMSGGQTSIGVRLNRVCWFKGALHKIRIAPQVLTPGQFALDQP